MSILMTLTFHEPKIETKELMWKPYFGLKSTTLEVLNTKVKMLCKTQLASNFEESFQCILFIYLFGIKHIKNRSKILILFKEKGTS